MAKVGGSKFEAFFFLGKNLYTKDVGSFRLRGVTSILKGNGSA